MRYILLIAFMYFNTANAEAKKVRIEGEVHVSITDDFENKKSETHVHIQDKITKKFHLLKLKDPKDAEKFKTGDIISVEGNLDANEDLELSGTPITTEYNSAGTRNVSISGQNKRNVVIILVNLLDGTAFRSADAMKTIMYAPTNSVQHYFLDTTLGKTLFYSDGNGDGNADIIGPVSVNLTGTDNCNYSGWASGADAAAGDLSIYQHRIYVLPGNTQCSWRGVGSLGGFRTWVRAGGVHTFAHELGHNLGMHHASTDPENDGTINSEYGDYSCVMDNATAMKYLNAPHMVQMGVFSSYSSKVVAASQGTMTLSSMSVDPLLTALPQVATLKKPDTGESYYLSYRTPVGYDANLSSTYLNGLNIHVSSGGSSKSKFVKNLLPGGTFLDSKNGIQITARVPASDASSISFDVLGTCASFNPSLAFSTSSTSVTPGGTTDISFTIKNNDNEFCGSTRFNLNLVLPTGVSGSLSANSVALNPGQSVSGKITVTAPLVDGTYPIALGASDLDGVSPSHNDVSTSSSLVVKTPTQKGKGGGGGGGKGKPN